MGAAFRASGFPAKDPMLGRDIGRWVLGGDHVRPFKSEFHGTGVFSQLGDGGTGPWVLSRRGFFLGIRSHVQTLALFTVSQLGATVMLRAGGRLGLRHRLFRFGPIWGLESRWGTVPVKRFEDSEDAIDLFTSPL